MPRRPVLALFWALVANQAATLVLSPILVEIARDFDVSVSAAGQLRAIAGAISGVAALALGAVAGRLGLKRTLLGGLALLALAAGLSAAAPSFAVLAAAQALGGLSIALVQASAVAGVTVWVPLEHRARALSWILPGQSAAWIAGMPLIGLVGGLSWRYAFLVVPLAAALPALALGTTLAPTAARATSARADLLDLARDRVVRAWAFGELCAYAAAGGTTVYLGALLIETYDVSLLVAGLVLGLAMLAYLPGSLLFRRWIDAASQRLLIGLGLAGAATAALIGALRPSVVVTAGLVVAFMFVNAGRTISGSAFGLDAAPSRAVAIMGVRTGMIQFGYLVGGGLGGVALHAGGYAATGATFATLYVLGVLPHVALRRGSARAAATGGG
ncbi:MAG: MFS transporter [Thermoleophilia bacterium]